MNDIFLNQDLLFASFWTILQIYAKYGKEENATNPKYLSYRRCVKRIEKCYQRGTLTKEQEKQLIRKAYDIYHVAITSPKYSNTELEELLKSKNLYTQCGITPPKKGRPKGVK